MKRLFSMALTLLLVLSIGMVAFAGNKEDADTSYEPGPDVATITIDKEVILGGDGYAKSPAETYNFTINPLSGAPAIGDGTFKIELDEGNNNGANTGITLPNYTSTGVYQYEVNEVEGTTAGVDYDGRTLILTVYVYSDGEGGIVRNVTLHDKDGEVKEKVDGFENTFSAGKLAITKEVTGNMGEQGREFNITVTLNQPNGKDIDTVSVSYSGGKYDNLPVSFNEGVASLELQIKHGDTITFENLPYGVTWTVEEDNYADDGYTTSNRENNGTIDAASDSVTITNHKDQGVETGVNLSSLPYFLVLGLAGAGLIGFSVRKRFTTND